MRGALCVVTRLYILYVEADESTSGWEIVIYKALCFDVAQGRMNGAPNETRTHSCRFASLVS